MLKISKQTTRSIILTLLICSSVFMLIGCTDNKDKNNDKAGEDNSDKKESTVYKYRNPDDTYNDFKLKKSVYEDDRLTLYFSGDDGLNNKDSYVKCYDKDGNQISDSKFNDHFYNDKIVIKSKDPQRISGVYIYPSENFDYYYKIRYLDSDDYAILTCWFVCDLGWEDTGDEDKYLFESEKQERKDAAAAADQNEKEAYEMLKGMWINQDDPNCTIEITENDYGGYNFVYYDPEYDETWDTSMESLYYYFDDYKDVYDFTGSTGNMTCPVYLWVSEDKEYLYYDSELSSPFVRPGVE